MATTEKRGRQNDELKISYCSWVKKKETSPSIKRKDKRNKLEEITGQLLWFTLSAECQGFAVIKIVKAQELVLTKN